MNTIYHISSGNKSTDSSRQDVQDLVRTCSRHVCATKVAAVHILLLEALDGPPARGSAVSRVLIDRSPSACRTASYRGAGFTFSWTRHRASLDDRLPQSGSIETMERHLERKTSSNANEVQLPGPRVLTFRIQRPTRCLLRLFATLSCTKSLAALPRFLKG